MNKFAMGENSTSSVTENLLGKKYFQNNNQYKQVAS